MIYKPEGRRYYRVKFRFKGRVIHRSTGATDAKTARSIEGKIRAELARGNWGILEERKLVSTLADFLRKEFLPYAESTAKPATVRYYTDGVKRLLTCEIAGLALDKITGQHAAQFAARYSYLSPSTVNCGLRTLRRALSLACQWGKIERTPKISLVQGERQRERVLSGDEAARYLDACPQPWRDVATVMLGTGMRPGEIYPLRWEHVLLNGEGGLIQVVGGKSKAARRLLPMVPAVYQALKVRQEAQGHPTEGWVFPTGSESGHLEESVAKKYHAKALALSGVKRFEPYCMRHTALTRLAESGCDAFTLARIAGHSSITVTQRYCHPQKDAIELAFQKVTESRKVVTNGGHHALLIDSSGDGSLPVAASSTAG